MVATVTVVLLASGCGALGLSEGGLVEPTVTTSAAIAAEADQAAPAVGVTIPTLQSGSTKPASTPTPWQSLTTTAAPTTTSEPPITALSTTKILTFTSVAPVTAPTVAAPTSIASPPPACYSQGSCPAQAATSVGDGKIEILNESGALQTEVVLTGPGHEPTSMSVARLSKPSVSCSGSYCLVAGTRSGLYFGSVVVAKSGTLQSVSGTASSSTPLTLVAGASPVVAGTYRFDSYGVTLDDSPVAAQTWAVSGGKLAVTGCGEPYLYATPPKPTGAVTGPCTGTPRIHGYSGSSGNTLTSLSGFVTPSGNIHCALLPNDNLVCTAKQNSVSVPTCAAAETEVPADLRGLRVIARSTGGITKDDCLGYTLIGLPESKISYRRLAVARGFVCEVLQDGVTCTTPVGTGFTLNRSALQTF